MRKEEESNVKFKLVLNANKIHLDLRGKIDIFHLYSWIYECLIKRKDKFRTRQDKTNKEKTAVYRPLSKHVSEQPHFNVTG